MRLEQVLRVIESRHCWMLVQLSFTAMRVNVFENCKSWKLHFLEVCVKLILGCSARESKQDTGREQENARDAETDIG